MSVADGDKAPVVDGKPPVVDGKPPVVDRDKVPVPRVRLSPLAAEQLGLIVRNDPTVEGKCLRVLISGKGCHGFDYQVGFDARREGDFVLPLRGLVPSGGSGDQVDPDASGGSGGPGADPGADLDLVMDPFTACYLQRCEVGYLRDPAVDEEGFVVVNEDQDAHRGKFWRRDPGMAPPVRRDRDRPSPSPDSAAAS